MSLRNWGTILPAALAVGVGVTAIVSPRQPFTIDPVQARSVGAEMGEEGLRASRRARLERLRQTIPGNGGEMQEGPAFADEEAFLQRAYPDKDIPAGRRSLARGGFHRVRGRGHGFGHRRPGDWFQIGPSSAIYQKTDFRLTYVPNRYVASGRVTAMAIGSHCRRDHCRVYVAAAGGGVWRTDEALDHRPSWKFLTGSVGINAIGSIVVDPSDSRKIWIGTGEANASGDSAAGVGLYRSSDGGHTLVGPLGVASFNNRSIGSIAVDPSNPNVVYVATTRGVRGVSSVTGGAISLVPGAPAWGLYKSTDRGATFTFIHNGSADASACTDPVVVATGTTPCSLRGVRRVAVDPLNPNIVYAGSYGRGVWRSNDGGATWTQINPSLNAADPNMRPEIAVTLLPNGKTRMYVGEGTSGSPTSRLFRSDDVATLPAPVFTNLTSPDPTQPGFGSFNYCSGQCWYDNLVATPPGHPDIVYLGGSYQYSEDLVTSNGRALVLSTDAGQTWTDMTKDATDDLHPNGLHPDHHALVVNPHDPYQFFSGSDGGVMRSSGDFADVSARCDTRGLSDPLLSRCRQLLSRVPERLHSMNRGLSTLQFQSLSVSPFDHRIVQGGTQDNGTFQTTGSTNVWLQTFWGDGGQSGFDAANPHFRFHSFFGPFMDVNFSDGALEDWNWISDRLQVEPAAFYPPLSSDPVHPGWMWAGLSHVWRTKTHGLGTLSRDEYRAQCNEFTGAFTIICGDWLPVAAASYEEPVFPFLTVPSPSSRLTASGALYGTDRAGGAVAAVERARDASTLWAATSTGRVFVSKNADAEPFGAVLFTRIDPSSALDPNRFVSGIYVDPTNPNRAWLSYSGYSAATPATPGHVFVVVYDPAHHYRDLDQPRRLRDPALPRSPGDGHRSRRPDRRPLRGHRLRCAAARCETETCGPSPAAASPSSRWPASPSCPTRVVSTPRPTASAPGA